ncbi:SUMF1/EgtB/PvdO family nonheme iron enzyme [bacterium]|nr:SUMF1/EgtB/PvdO family nonheme iron enzyme [bacterium]
MGLKLPNAFGLFDMSGNVAEWCEDWVNDRYNGAPTDGSPWTMGNGAGRIVRGGGVYVDLDDVRSAARAAYTPDSYGHPLGLRVVRSLESAVAHVDSATIGAFLPPSVTQRLSTSNGGMLTGSGTGAVGYHWITEKDGVSVHDSGPLAASMVDGQATLHLYHGFPTALSGLYESFIRITSQSPYLESPRASYTVQDTTALVGYVSLNVFSPLTQLRGAKVSNNGAVYGFDHGRVDYHWTTERDGVVVHDSGPLSVVMKYGAAAIPAYDGFPTNVAGHYTSHIRVTSQSPEWVSLNADYSVISFEGEGVTIDLPGLPADATPLVLVKIPAGSFMMGRYPGENESRANEDPQHRVDIGYDFYIGKYEITKAQWQTMMGTAPWVGGATSTSLVPNAAANWISWNSIREPGGFLDKINALGQGIFRLPSEAEWEYACRACTTTSYYWGDSPMPLNDYAWFRPLPGLGPQGDERDSPTVVGLKLPNPFGLYDIIGNAEEWCEDWWNTGYQGAPTDGSAWRVGDDGNRIARGGGVLSTYSDCRSAYRHWRAPGSLEYWDTGGRVFGFRIVRTVESATANVDSVSVGSFAPPVLNQRDTTSNEGMLHGQGTGAVGYHWLTYKDGQFLHDSGPFVVSMADGQATIPPYDLFPTALPGDYESVIEVTSQSLRLHSATASYTVLPTTGTVDSISISLFSPLTTLQGNPVANYGSFSGSGHGAVEYHWLTERDGAFAHDSGPLTVQMIDGEADIPTYAGFPTDATGHYESYIWVTSQKPEMVSLTADYSVISTAGQNEIVIHLPGLPADATPLVMVRIPAGSFMMGRYPWEVDANSNEAPQHRVDIGYDFYIGKYEITKAQWQAIMGTTPWVGQGTGWNIGPQSPATYVSWDDIRGASGFLDKLNALGQGRFRLPSEAEWEYACRACTPTRYYWGDDPGDKHVGAYAWYVGNHFEDGEFGPHNVGQKIPNNFALFDMSGNVAEWCEDWWNRNYQNAPADGSAWTSETLRNMYREDSSRYRQPWSIRKAPDSSSGSPSSAGRLPCVVLSVIQ